MVSVLGRRQNYDHRGLRSLVEGAVSRFGVRGQLAGEARLDLGVSETEARLESLLL